MTAKSTAAARFAADLRQARTALDDIKARNAAARRAAIASLTTYRSATLGRQVTIPEN